MSLLRGTKKDVLEMLDRIFEWTDGTILTVISYQEGSQFLQVPYWVRCEVQGTSEIVIADPEQLRAKGTDITPPNPLRVASRKPHVATDTEVMRLVAWRHPRELLRETHQAEERRLKEKMDEE